MRALLALVAALGLGACVTTSGTLTPVWLPPEGVDDAQATALAQTCLEQTADIRAPRGPTPYSPASSGAAGAFGAALGAGLAQGMADSAARRPALNACLAEAGFRGVLLSREERTALNRLQGAERLAFLEAAYQSQKPGVFSGPRQPIASVAAQEPPSDPGNDSDAAPIEPAPQAEPAPVS